MEYPFGRVTPAAGSCPDPRHRRRCLGLRYSASARQTRVSALEQADRHRLERQQRRDVGLDRLAAAGRARRSAGSSARESSGSPSCSMSLAQLGVDQFGAGTGLDDQNVAVQAPSGRPATDRARRVPSVWRAPSAGLRAPSAPRRPRAAWRPSCRRRAPARARSRSFSSTFAALALASSLAASTSCCAAFRQAPMSRSANGTSSTFVRRAPHLLVTRQRPAPDRCAPARPAPRIRPARRRSRSCRVSISATASTGGVRSTSNRQRERIVGTTSSTVGAHSTHTVRGAGSSMLFSNASAACSVSRSASSTTITCQRPWVGLIAARRTSSRISPTRIDSSSVRISDTSGCAPLSAVRQTAAFATAVVQALQRRPRRHGRRSTGPSPAGR